MQEQGSEDGGYPASLFLAPPDADFKCGICMEIMRDPVQICSVHHTYCVGCISRWRSTKTTCPDCRAPISREEPARILKNMIEKLEVGCPHAACNGGSNSGDSGSGSGMTNSSSSSSGDATADAEDGHQHKKSRQENSAEPSSAAATYCAWTGQVKDYEAHMAVCPFVEVCCPFAEAGCTFRAARRDMGAHRGDMGAHFLMLMTSAAADKAERAAVKAESAAESAKVKAENLSMASEIRSLQRYVTILHAPGEEAAVDVMWAPAYPADDYEEEDSTYTGQMRKGLDEGEWVRHGFGKKTWPEGEFLSYDGQWRDGKAHGQGKFKWRNGDSYSGQFKEGESHGQGIFKWDTGDEYQGAFEDDKMHGRGRYTASNGDMYLGLFKKEKKHGHGIERYSDSGLYKGQWKEDLRHGQGVYTHRNGNTYVGQWEDDRRHGQGVYKYTFVDGMGHASGDSEVGNTTRDQKEGIFVYTKADGASYEREYEENMMTREEEEPIP